MNDRIVFSLHAGPLIGAKEKENLKLKFILSLPDEEATMSEYKNAEDLQRFISLAGCSGIETIRCARSSSSLLREVKVLGVHMWFYLSWLDFFLGDMKRVEEDFGSLEAAFDFYGGEDFSCIMREYEKDLEHARELGAEYVVFHIADVPVSEVYSYRHFHSDRDVIDASVHILNSLLAGKEDRYDFHLLLENLWWPGMNFGNPEETGYLLNGIKYEKTGIMLDIGHLLCTDLNLKSQEEACRYILSVISEHEEVIPGFTDKIKGIHLHQSLSGEFVESMLAEPPEDSGSYLHRFARAYDYLGKIDTHSPWTSPKIREVLKKISPGYVVHELRAKSRKELLYKIRMQSKALGLKI